jgi:hypothetical protein
MPYRLVILSGEQHGEKVEIAEAPLVFGKGASCPLRVNDPDCGEAHAELFRKDGVLFIKSLGEPFSIQVNERILHESPLKHGDVVQIGTTRFFIQEFAEPGLWKTISRLKNKRIWLTAGIPLLLVLGVTLLLTRFQHGNPTVPPAPAPIIEPPVTTSEGPDDSVVTNVLRIQIDPSVTLTTKPPELTEADRVLESLSTNTIRETLEAARAELEQGTRFLFEKSTSESSVTNRREEATTDLTRAEESLRATVTNPATATLPAPDVLTQE